MDEHAFPDRADGPVSPASGFRYLGLTRGGLVRVEVELTDGSVFPIEVEADELLDPKRFAAACRTELAPDAWFVVEQGILPEVPRRVFRTFTGDALMRVDFPPVRYIVPGILPEGLAVLAGKPKIGKSWWSMGHALDVARTGSVLYLALEDPPRRLQQRAKTLLGGAPMPGTIEWRTEWPRLDDGGLDAIEAWLNDHPIARLVVIDTLAKVRPPRGRSEDGYLGDYGVWGALQAMTLNHPGLAILGNHHQRKGEAEDILDTVLGSQGLTGSVDTILVLKKARGEADGELFVTGRDIEEEQERALRFENGRWTDIGSASEHRQTQERRDLIDLLRVEGPQTIPEVQRKLSLGSYDAARKRLKRASDAGEVEKRSNGKWGVQ